MAQALVDKYEPKRIADFIGLEKVKRILTVFVADPSESAWLFTGPSGTGKTSMAHAVAAELPRLQPSKDGFNIFGTPLEDVKLDDNYGRAEEIMIPAKNCNIDRVRWLAERCAYHPRAASWRVIIIDEADEMSYDAYIAFLSVLQPIAPHNIFIFTRNLPPTEIIKQKDGIEKKVVKDTLEHRFKKRCRELNFTTQGLRDDLACHLEHIWSIEAPPGANPPTFEMIAKDSRNNIRGALNELELRLLEARADAKDMA